MAPGIDLGQFRKNIEKLHQPTDFSGKVYVMSNEYGIPDSRAAIEKLALKGEAFIGVSGLDNWEMICSLDAKVAVLFDYSPKVVKFHQKCLDMIANSSSKLDFVHQLHTHILANPDDFYYNSRLMKESIVGLKFKDPRFINELRRIELTERFLATGADASPLSTDAGFEKLRKMAREGRIISICADLADTEKMAAISCNITELGYKISAIYLSNVYDHGLKSGDAATPKKMRQSLVALCANANPLIIDATFFRSIFKIMRHTALWEQQDGSHYDLDALRS